MLNKCLITRIRVNTSKSSCETTALVSINCRLKTVLKNVYPFNDAQSDIAYHHYIPINKQITKSIEFSLLNSDILCETLFTFLKSFLGIKTLTLLYFERFLFSSWNF